MKTYDLPQPLARQVLREADEELRAQHRRGIFDDGDPNHPRHNNGINYATGKPLSLFGFNVDAFMAKQHR